MAENPTGTVEHPDVVVIGGGIVGCAVAWFTTRSGLRTLLLDRAGIATGSSGSCMGHLMMISAPDEMYRLSRRSLDLWHRFHAEVGGFEMRNCGCLWIGETAEDMPLLQEMHRAVQKLGDEGTILDRRDLLLREPELAPDLCGAYYYPRDSVVFPMQAAGALLGAAVRRGCRVQTHTEVRALRRGSDGAVRAVVTNRGEIETAAVVNAAGVWAPDVTEMAGLTRAPIFPRRGDLAITMPQDLPVQHQMVEVAYLRTATGKAPDPEDVEPDPGAYALNIQPQGNGTVLVGSTRQFAGYDRRVDRRLLGASLERAARFLPVVDELQIVRTWAGLRPYTRDKRPILGPVDSVPGLYMAGGHEGLGITLSMATGELIAQAIRGHSPSQPLEPFGLSRFEPAAEKVVRDG